MSINVVYNTVSSFEDWVSTDIGLYSIGRRIRAYCGVDGYIYGNVESATWNGTDYIDVVLDNMSGNLTSNLEYIELSVVKASSDGNLCEHDHSDGDKGGTIDHGNINGLSDDDHEQYHNDTRGDARYYTQTQLTDGSLDLDVDTIVANEYLAPTDFTYSITDLNVSNKNIIPLMMGSWSDAFAFPSVVQDEEYWDGSAWQTFVGDNSFAVLFDQNPTTKVTLEQSVSSKFRFTMSTGMTYHSSGLIQVFQQWSSAGPKGYTITIENDSDANFSTPTIMLSGSSSVTENYFYNAFINDHTADRYYRITIEITDWRTTGTTAVFATIKNFTTFLYTGKYYGRPYYYDWQKNVYFDNAIELRHGTLVNEFSTDGTFAGNSDLAVATEKASKTYMDTGLSGKSDLGHDHTSSDVTDFAEAVDDQVNTLLTAGPNIVLTYDDGSGTLEISGSAGYIDDNNIRITTSKTPSTSNATGNKGEICWDSDYIYVCIDTNTWKRAALSTW